MQYHVVVNHVVFYVLLSQVRHNYEVSYRLCHSPGLGGIRTVSRLWDLQLAALISYGVYMPPWDIHPGVDIWYEIVTPGDYLILHLWPLLLTWFNFNPSMDK